MEKSTWRRSLEEQLDVESRCDRTMGVAANMQAELCVVRIESSTMTRSHDVEGLSWKQITEPNLLVSREATATGINKRE